MLSEADIFLMTNKPKNLTSALWIQNDPVIRITVRYMTPQDRNKYYYETDMNEMLATELADNEYMNDFYGRVSLFFIFFT